MTVMICYCSKPSRGIPALRSSDLDATFEMWSLPGQARRGDVSIIYAAGSEHAYLGTETVTSNWRTFRSGPHRGSDYIEAGGTRLFSRPVPAGEVDAALGLRRPTGPTSLPEPIGSELLRFLRRRRVDPIENAIEGIITESRRTNRSRNPRLRAEVLRRSRGRCEACGTDYRKLSGVDGGRVLTVHHRKQLSAFDEPVEMTVDDLAVVCANCHALIHSDPKAAMPVEDLRKLLQPGFRRR
jgi:hypothetical protein